MYRAPRHYAATTVAAAMGHAVVPRRAYTPIFASDPARDTIAPLRHADELHTLWARELLVPTIGRAVQLWLRYGNDPVAHTSVVPHMPDGTRGTTPAFPSASPFAYVEDFAGTNLVDSDAQRIRESIELWSAYYEKKFLMRLRQSRRTSANHIGVISAPDVASDEADQPGTKWSQDTHFREVAFLSERHLKEKVSNPLQLEEALVTKASPEQFLAFFQAYQQETASQVPLPVPSVWVYEGEARRMWVERYHPVAKAAFDFFKRVLSADVKAAKSPEAVTRAVAAAMKKLHAVQLSRIARQVKAGVCPDWTSPATTPAQKLAWTQNACERMQRSILEGDADPEDLLDSSDAWKREHDELETILNAPVDGCAFTLKDFWMHTLRREELETVHVWESDHLRDVAAAAQRAVLDELHGDFAALFAGIEDAIARGSLDLRAATFVPRFNPTFAKLHYAKFGSSAVVQHTNTASRQLQFHYASSVEELVATANLYYATKPMSTKLNYASPYTLRKSLVALCAAYGVDMTHAAQKPFLASAATLARAEGLIGRVVRAAAAPYGVARRAWQQQTRQEHQRLLSPVDKVAVYEPVSELLPAGADPANIASASGGEESLTLAKAWPLGAVKTVRYHWPSPELEKLKFFLQANSISGGSAGGSGADAASAMNMTAEKLAALEELTRGGRLEVSLWRRRTAAETASADAAAAKEQEEVAHLVAQHAELAEVQQYARSLFRRLSRLPALNNDGTTISSSSTENGEWVFAAMLNDNVALNEEERVSVYLPFTDADGVALPQGEYRVRVRAYGGQHVDSARGGPGVHATMCTEAFSASFPVFDALPQLVAQFFETASPASAATATRVDIASFPGKDLVPLCAFFRAAGLEVPLRVEFEAGQGLDTHGNIPMSRFLALLRGKNSAIQGFRQRDSERGLTDVQREIEPDCRAHWQLYHPGADAEEWACARRDVLHRAMSQEREWWLPDPLLDVGDTVTGPVSDSGVSPASYPSTARYGTELCSVLSASGSSREDEAAPPAPGTADAHPRADCTVDGSGAITSLQFSGSAVDATLEGALQVALDATRRAQDRHCTLSMFKLAPFEKAAQAASFCGVHSQEFGGKYARTYSYALEKAKREMAETLVSGRVVLGADDDSDKARLSEQEKKVDRFASSTHPELRKKQFVSRLTYSGQTVEDPSPDQTSTWNR